MTNKEMKWIKSIALVMAVVLLVSVGFIANGKALKAEEDTEAYTPVEATPSETVQEIVIETEEEAAPAEETEAAEEAVEGEEAVLEPVEEASEAFDVVKAYEYYKTLDEAGKAEYLASLSEADRAALLEYIANKEADGAEEEAAPVEEAEKKIDLWYDLAGTPKDGDTITIKSAISGYGENVSYQWKYSVDGVTWTDIAGATGPSYTFVLDSTNCRYMWDLAVSENG